MFRYLSQGDKCQKISGGADAIFKFEVRYKNGVISEPATIDEIIQEENDGSKSIVYLKISATDSTNVGNEITVEFADISANQVGDFTPMAYVVKSSDKDWTFISSSTISERMSKVKKNNVLKVINGLPYFIITNFILLGFMAFAVIKQRADAGKEALAIKSIKDSTRDVYDYVYKIDLMRASRSYGSERYMNSTMPYIIGVMGLLVIGFFATSALSKWYPNYTFYWGDQIKKYDSKISLTKFVSVGIVLALILGVSGNYISNKIF